jgi:hypothetical protein
VLVLVFGGGNALPLLLLRRRRWWRLLLLQLLLLLLLQPLLLLLLLLLPLLLLVMMVFSLGPALCDGRTTSGTCLVMALFCHMESPLRSGREFDARRRRTTQQHPLSPRARVK